MINLEIPADQRFIRLARLLASGAGDAAGFSVEEVSDLRVAVDEACCVLLAAGARGLLRIRLTVGHQHVLATITAHGAHAIDRGDGDTYWRTVLDAVVNAWSIERAMDATAIHLDKSVSTIEEPTVSHDVDGE